MKKKLHTLLLTTLCLLLAGCGKNGSEVKVWPIILVILAVLLLALAGLRTYSHIQYVRRQLRRKNSRRRVRKNLDTVTLVIYGLAAVLLLSALLGSCSGSKNEEIPEETEPVETEATEPPAVFAPMNTADTDPDNWGIRWEIFQNNTLLHSYTRENVINFGEPEDYFSLPGIAAFRGNNYRNSATYGTADVTEKTLTTAWTVQTSTLEGTSWSGSGWTGQPLIVQWDAETRNNMNLYPEKKAKETLVEVIYATLDGHIYFLDLDDGSYTRDPLNVGMCFKGAGSLDPRGYPIMYVGSGDTNAQEERPRMFIISLIDGTILYEGGYDETIALRRDHDNWCSFDSSPLVDKKTDTLIWPGENGLLYTIRLNSKYDKTAGTVSIAPDAPVVTRYHTARSGDDAYWYGYEASVCVAEGYLYVSENGGMFYCVDLNTMELVWAQDTADDSNSTPVLERISEDEAYLYTAPSLHWTKDENNQGSICIYKLDATTGKILWQKPYDVHTIEDLSGGVQSSPVLGQVGTSLEGLIIYTIARTPNVESGIMVALDTETGQEVWRMDMDNYAWSSPVAVYDNDGTGYLVACDSAGYAFFVNGATGELLYTLYLGGLVEASPAVFGNKLVVGTRTCTIAGVEIA